ncbi:hypothetical protein J2X97_002097 [Epilithonimonas hungarica]|uniref:hypothetical protein n=1 Tax=Epilithonimonas hungarica TaxID=454006 RepID=UPI00278AF437|nr:hypothetical protein [Epilithonimonas hungarica]MDP9956438.1 hypothetical protein [Epilithonimonas hungarica]
MSEMPNYTSVDDIENINTRLLVIEKSILLEQLSSMTIAELLEISDWENSKMLGNQSSGFSFNQKINFFIDLSNLENDIKNKFLAIQEIRNKFAHVYKVSSFENYKILDKNSATNCNKLENWYASKIEDYKDNNELKFKYLFLELFSELAQYTIKTAINQAINKGILVARQNFIKDYMEELEKLVLTLPNGQNLKNFVLDELEKRKC